MTEAINLSVKNVDEGGGPFGAVITRNGKIVGTGVNRVTLKNDPSAHAEVEAIRDACSRLGTFDLSGCDIYASCEPCPMCLAAIYWAKLDRLFYAGTRHDAADAGFRDDMIYLEIAADISERKLVSVNIMNEEAKAAFHKWNNHDGKRKY